MNSSIERVTLKGHCRVDFLGGTTDLWPLYCYLGHARVINMGIPVACKVAVEWDKTKKDFSLEIESIEMNKKSTHRSIAALKKDVAASAKANPLRWIHRLVLCSLERAGVGVDHGTFRVRIQSDAPPGSGLGGSSVLGATVVKAFADLLGCPFTSPWAIHSFVYHHEAAEIEKPAGEQDAIPALFGGFLSFEMIAEQKHVQQYPDALARTIAGRCALIHTGKPHHSGINNWDVFKKFHEGNKKVRRALTGIRDLSDEADACLKKNDVEAFVRLVNEEWKLRSQLSSTFDVPILGQAWKFAKSLGAISRKACGAGGGGSLLVIFKDEKARNDAVKEKLPKKDWLWIPLSYVSESLC